MKRSIPPRPPRSESIAALLASTQRPVTQARMATAQTLAGQPAKLPPKLPRQARTDTAIRDSARGEECHMRLEGICNGDPETTVWSHWPGLAGDRGMGLKSLDLAGCYTCSACHDAIDGRGNISVPRTDVVLAWMFGHLRSIVTLARKGLA